MPTADLPRLSAALAARYRIIRPLGAGGMGAVYLAQELALDRPVALKVLPAEFAADAALRERFLLETRTTASFSHPNIVPVYGIEAQDDLLAYAMAYVEGESVKERVARAGPLPARALVRLMHDAAYALAYAHGRGIVHRDIKPDNIMLERATSRALVMDFGIARPIGAPVAGRDGLTRVGEVVGTPEYMSPEQACGEAVDGRSDLYSLGLVMWFAAAGRTAMAGDTPQRVLARQLGEVLPPIASVRPDLPPALASAIDRCVAKEPAERHADAAALAQALDDAELAAPEVPLPIRMVANELRTAGLVAVLGLVLAVLSARRYSDEGMSVLDQLIPLVFFGAVIVARGIQALTEVSRLGRLGFDATALARGLRAVLEEGASTRAAARLDAGVRADRRRELITAAVMLAIAAVSLFFAYQLRRPLGRGNYAVTPLGVALFFNALASAAAAVVIASRSPFREGPGERAFRWLWLGPVGGAVLRWALRRAGPPATRATGASGVAVGTASAVVTGTAPTSAISGAPGESVDARFARIEARLEALEQRGASSRR